MKRCSLFSALALGVFYAALGLAHAEDENVKMQIEKAPALESEARFMLRDTTASDSIERKPTAADFSWNALTKSGPASGANPVIGEKSGKARYDFKDGLPHPYYLSPGKNS